MHLISVLLPLYDNDRRALSRDLFREVAAELAAAFGGLTAHTRAPAEGLWHSSDDTSPTRDDIVIYEVMVESVDRAWWAKYRRELEHRFKQEHVVVRAQHIEVL